MHLACCTTQTIIQNTPRYLLNGCLPHTGRQRPGRSLHPCLVGPAGSTTTAELRQAQPGQERRDVEVTQSPREYIAVKPIQQPAVSWDEVAGVLRQKANTSTCQDLRLAHAGADHNTTARNGHIRGSTCASRTPTACLSCAQPIFSCQPVLVVPAHLQPCITLHDGLYKISKQAAGKRQHLQQQQSAEAGMLRIHPG